jgi:hypothetical protein
MFGATLMADDQPAKSDSRTAAAMELLATMKMDKQLTASMEQMLQLQVQQDPNLAPYREVMRKFLMKYIGWESLKGELARIYAEEFTEQELRDIIAFYRTPTGAKTVAKFPVLMVKSSQLGAQRVQQNTAELTEMIRAEQKRQKK